MRRIENLLLTFAISIAGGGCSDSLPEEVPDERGSSGGSSSGTSTTGVASPDTEDTIADESSASGSASGSSTGEAAESSSSGGPPEPVCGNGRVEADEQCDDGNDSEFDECTTTCTMPTCDDGVHDGAEADVDCGGPCDAPCATCQMCLGNEDCAEPETCNAAGQCTLTQLVQIDWLVHCGAGPENGLTLAEFPAGDYLATALPSAGTLWLPPHNPPSSGYFWEAQSPQVTFTQLQTPTGIRYEDVDTAFANMRATTEVFTHAGGDITFYREDLTCPDNAGGLEFTIETCCEGAC